jgi:polyhydroxyalkanoate synthesis regulator phasin
MVDILKKASLVTAELISLTADKVQEVADDFVKKGTLHDNEAKKFVSEVRSTLESREKEFTDRLEQITGSLQQLGSSLGLPKLAEKENIETRIDELERHIDELKARRDVIAKEQKKEVAANGNNKAPAAK